LAIVILWVGSLALPALAREGAPEVVVSNRLYDLGWKLEVAFSPLSASIFNKYTSHIGLSLGLAYHFHDAFGLEVEGGFNYIAGKRKLLDSIVSTSGSALGQVEYLPLSDLKYMQGYAQGGVIFSPLYGKLNLGAELAFGIHLYFVAGGGVGFFKYSKIANPRDATTVPRVLTEENAGTKGMFYFGGGLRLHILNWLNVRLEVRDQCTPDIYQAEINRPCGPPVCPETRETTPTEIKDFIHIVSFRLVSSFTF
jgi:outer membrane beta-barrel protein